MKKQITVNVMLLIFIGIIFSTITIGGAYAVTNYAIDSKNVEYTDNSSLGVTNVQAAIDGTCTKFNNQLTTLESNIIDKIYPVGSIYISETDDTVSDVQTRFGGTWIAYGKGKTLIGAGTGTDANGNSQTFSVSNNSSNLGEYKHKLTVSEMPSHSHGIGMIQDSSATLMNLDYLTGRNATDHLGWSDTETMYGRLNGGYTQTVGGSSYHNNLQPYVTVYMYKRTA